MKNNNSRRGALLASFLKTDDEEEILGEVQYIADTFELTNNLIFLLASAEDPSKKIITYNTQLTNSKISNTRLYTIRVHRKKNTNTLYTINALNLAVAKDNNGQTGRHLKLDWEQYENSLLLTKNKDLAVTPVRVIKIFRIEVDETPAKEED
jgi:hypothetical protein